VKSWRMNKASRDLSERNRPGSDLTFHGYPWDSGMAPGKALSVVGSSISGKLGSGLSSCIVF